MPDDLPRQLLRRLRHPLPGREAQRRFEPPLACGRHFDPPPAGARMAEVMILLYPRDGSWHIPLVLRPEAMQSHAGQVSLPGGLIEPGEEPARAALRELEEELGVPRETVRVLGSLSPLYVFVTGFHVTPWLGWTAEQPRFVPSPAEVDEVLELPLAHLLDPAHTGRHVRRDRGIAFTVPHVSWEGHLIWGATSMLLAELAAVVQSAA